MAKHKKKKQKIIIYFKDGKEDRIPQKLWTGYEYLDRLFVVTYKKQWIAIYNMDDITCIAIG